MKHQGRRLIGYASQTERSLVERARSLRIGGGQKHDRLVKLRQHSAERQPQRPGHGASRSQRAIAAAVRRRDWSGLNPARSLRLPEQLAKQLFRLLPTLLRETNGFRLADRILDIALLMETIQSIPIVALPGCGPVLIIASGQIEQSKDCVIDLVGIDVHGAGASKPACPLGIVAASRRPGFEAAQQSQRPAGRGGATARNA